MKTELEILFFVDSNLRSEVINLFNKYNIFVESPESDRTSEVTFNIKVPIDKSLSYDTVKVIYEYLERQLKIDLIGEKISFICSDDEYRQSPLFILESTGNSQNAFLKDKGTKFHKETFCKVCGLIKREQLSPLVIDTSKIKDRYMVNVGPFWVVSEKMVDLMDNWNLKGYDLNPVEHKGPEAGRQQAYQIIPKTTLPNWSSQMVHFYYATEPEPCVCGIKRTRNGPFHYDKEDLKDIESDIYLPAEWSHDGRFLYKKTLFSKKFRDLMIENKISKDIRGSNDEKYGSKDWLLEPVILV